MSAIKNNGPEKLNELEIVVFLYGYCKNQSSRTINIGYCFAENEANLSQPRRNLFHVQRVFILSPKHISTNRGDFFLLKLDSQLRSLLMLKASLLVEITTTIHI